MPTTAEALQTAFHHHQAGQLREAEVLYRQILEVEPDHADALHLLGLVAYQGGRAELAVAPIRRAVALCGDRAVFHGNLGEAYRVIGKLREAEDCLRQALRLDPHLPDAHNSLGAVLRATGRTDEAIAAFDEAIRLRPDFAEAHNNLGALLQMRGDSRAAVAAFERALACRPNYVDASNNLGTVWKEQGRLEEAAACYRKALQLAPNESEGHLNLGTVYHARGQLSEAIACFREALRLDPSSRAAQRNLGTALGESGRHEEAIASFRALVELDSQSADAHFHLGTALHAQENWPAAAAEYRKALGLDPKHAKTLANLGSVLQRQGECDESLAMLDRALELDPTMAQAHLNRANLYKLQKRTAEAVAGYETALRLRPDFPEAYNNLAVLFNDMDQPDAAVACCRKGLEQQPASAALYANLATALQNLGRAGEAIECARKSVELRPEGPGEYTNLLYKLNFHPDYGAAEIFAEHLAWAERHAEPLTRVARPHANDPAPERRLRVGYVSPYFREHAVNFFSEPMIAAHDHRAFEIFCYSDVQFGDAATERLRRAADQWRDVRQLTDEQLAQRVRDDTIDILVDLTGHIAGNRLLAFARKPAPVQVTYIGYQNTTGMSAMDYRLTDAWADPPGATDAYYVEKLVRLPRSFFCYRPDDPSPAIAPLPALAAGRITFGAFNNFAKVSPRTLEVWLSILERLPDSRLLLLARGGGSLERRVGELARARAIDPRRIEFCDKRPRAQYLQLVAQADVALDPFPFNGHTTTCDAIWMGVPVVMLAGQSYASRFGGSVLRNVGLEHLVADSAERYVEIAVELATNPTELARLRETLRPRMAASPLLDAQGFTRHLETAYRDMWRAWCERPQQR
jgi:protein O-GlcNAc transferase